MKYLYLLIDFLTVIVPLLFSFHPKLKFHKNFKSFFFANGIVAIIFISWDMLFTKIGVWAFNPDYISGTYLFNLPIEEILFFVCIPFSCVFTYHCLNKFYKINWSHEIENIVVLLLSVIFLCTGIYFFDKLYTSSTFISLGILILVIKYIIKVDWLAKLMIIYPLLLIPFFIVNGILTGTGIAHPVVWYDNTENIGVRFLTIPLEDVFYGFELILLNVFFYEYFKRKFSRGKTFSSLSTF